MMNAAALALNKEYIRKELQKHHDGLERQQTPSLGGKDRYLLCPRHELGWATAMHRVDRVLSRVLLELT